MIPDGYGEVRFYFGGAAVPRGGMTAFGFVAGESGMTIEDTAEYFRDGFHSTIMDYCVAGVVLIGTEVKYGPEATGPSLLLSSNLPGTGGSAETFPQASWLLNKGTAFGGRAGRGRSFVPGIGENQVNSSGVIVDAHRNGMSAQCEIFRNDAVLRDMDLVVLHGPDSPLSTPTPISSLVADSRIATQRRRLRG